MNRPVAFARFWRDLLVGDDWQAAAGIALAIALTAALAEAGMPAWWLLPVAVVVLLASSLRRAAD